MTGYLVVIAFLLSQAPRQLLIFGDPNWRAVKEQLELLKKDSAGLREREVVVTMAGVGDAAWKRFAVPLHSDFTVVLVGKDGGEKYRSHRPLSTAELFALIDAMPMRRAEMRRRRIP